MDPDMLEIYESSIVKSASTPGTRAPCSRQSPGSPLRRCSDFFNLEEFRPFTTTRWANTGTTSGLNIFRGTEASAIEKCHGLGGAIEHLRTARRDSQGEFFVTRAFFYDARAHSRPGIIHLGLA